MSRQDKIDTERFQDALKAERLVRARTISWLRVVIVGVNLVIVLLLRWTVPGWTAPVEAVMAYCAAAVAVYWASRRSDRLAWWAAALIPVVDMPMLFWVVTQIIADLDASGAAMDALAWRVITASFFALLILLASLALERAGLIVVTGIAVVLEVWLLPGRSSRPYEANHHSCPSDYDGLPWPTTRIDVPWRWWGQQPTSRCGGSVWGATSPRRSRHTSSVRSEICGRERDER